jgi:orotate phosphoribosyltransferase
LFSRRAFAKASSPHGYESTGFHAHGGIVSAVGVIVDRSGQAKPNFGCPFVSLIEIIVETFPPDGLPPDVAKIPAVKPGSK